MTYPKKGSQADRILQSLISAEGKWVSGTYFLRTLFLSQFHARIWDLENVYGWKIEHSEDTDEFGFKSYRILEPVQQPLFV